MQKLESNVIQYTSYCLMSVKWQFFGGSIQFQQFLTFFKKWEKKKKKENTLPLVIFTMWTELSFEPVRARLESELMAKHVNPSV